MGMVGDQPNPKVITERGKGGELERFQSKSLLVAKRRRLLMGVGR